MSQPTNDTALQLSQALANAAAAAGPSVVNLDARHRGSSGVVWSPDGIVVTADHTLERDEDITVGLDDGRRLPATLVGRDPATDVAALRIAAGGLAAAGAPEEPGSGGLEGLAVGHLTLSLSRPGRALRAMLGVVSELRDEWRTRAGGRIDRFVQTDAGRERGYSGSLVVDVRGRPLGINTAGLLRGGGVVIPAATVRRVVAALLQHGRVRQGYLGVSAYPVRLPAPLDARVGQATALMLLGVQPGSPADRAGVLLGDVLLGFDGQPLGDLGQLHALLAEERIGGEVTLRLLRAGEVQERRVEVGARE